MISDSSGRWRTWGRAAGMAIAAALLTLFFFTPRVAIWRGLDVPMARGFPEVNRAAYALAQVDQPWAEIDSVSNQVIRWRLLFPILAHGLRLPDWAFLALPHLGCLLVLGFVARLLLKRGWSNGETVAATIVMATSSWFFVSTGWLAYFDSWCVLGMLLVSFARRRSLFVAALLLAPWVDERFVFALPISLLVRAEFFQQEKKDWLKDLVVGGVGLLPWLAIRTGLIFAADDRMTGSYVQSLWERRESLLARSHLEGAWHGLRWGWVFVVAGVLGAGRRWTLGVVAAATLAVVFILADDLSRATAILMPIAALGVVCRERLTGVSLTAGRVMVLAALNLLFPAKHVVATWGPPITYLYRELERLDDPPVEVDPAALASSAESYVAQGRLKLARVYFDSALKIDGEHVEALRGRAELQLQAGSIAAAASDVATALDAAPDDPDLLLVSARIFLASGQRSHAAEALRAALRAAPATWSNHAAATAELERLEAPSEH